MYLRFEPGKLTPENASGGLRDNTEVTPGSLGIKLQCLARGREPSLFDFSGHVHVDQRRIVYMRLMID